MTTGRRILICSLLTAIGCLSLFAGKSQSCPFNIDFEQGNFAGWTCYTGSVASVGGQNVISFNYSGMPVYNRHTIYGPNSGFDEYGGFPKNCPNGSRYSLKLGNDLAGTEAEGVSYDFNVPANADVYNLIYNYAVVFQDPAHDPSEQPRMEIHIVNLTDRKEIYCSSFTFFPIGSGLPGFERSTVQAGDAPVWYKPWTAVSINLNGNAGKRIRIFLKTADCTFRRHFGYAYIDVNSECSDKFPGADYCPDDTAVYLTAPYGYQQYTWYDNTFTQVLGTTQTISFIPPPPAGTTVAVVVKPYEGYGCEDTLYTSLNDTLHLLADAGPDQVACNHTGVMLGDIPRSGWTYHWTPSTGLSDPNIANPVANPDSYTTYVLTLRHSGGGCISTDTVNVDAVALDTSLIVQGKTNWCIGSGDSTVLYVQPADSIQWMKDNVAIPGAHGTRLFITQSGVYHAELYNFKGCALTTRRITVNISTIPQAGFRIDNDKQCLLGNKFTFTNNSTNSIGEMQYLWKFGDGDIASTRDVSHSYTRIGNFTITLVVNSNAVCADSFSLPVIVFPNLKAEFSIDPTCINRPVLPLNKTADPGNSPAHYLWSFGNGQTSTLQNPPAQVYRSPGNFVMSLSAYTDQCPTPVSTQRRFVRVEEPRPGVRYAVKTAVINLPLELETRSFADQVLWSPATQLNDPASFHPVFNGRNEQLYTIELTTAAGCVTVDTQLVRISNSIQVLVPNAFTPNNDGLNDVLTPILIGIKSVSYFRIFNRWGQLLFETRGKNSGWDGKFKGVPVEPQAVVWMFEGTGVDNNIYTRKGSSVIIW